MSPTETLPYGALLSEESDRYVIAPIETRSGAEPEQSASQTTLFQKAVTKIEIALLPMTIAAAFVAPGIGGEFTKTLVRTSSTRSVGRFWDWDDDGWFFTEEAAALAEVQALNALLALPAAEGFSPEFSD